MKDPTRGGFASAVNEMARKSGVSLRISEEALPIRKSVKSASGMLGIDPLQVANEGKVIMGVPEEEAANVLRALKAHHYGHDAAIIGRVEKGAFNHQSNGRSDVISGSWNRLIASFGVEKGDLGILGRLWWRIPESDDSDDNPTISDYYGWGDLSAIYKWRGQSFAATIRGNPSTGKGAGQLTWTSAPLLGPVRGYLKLFSGYGETLIDYNWRQTTIGIGVTLNDWL